LMGRRAGLDVMEKSPSPAGNEINSFVIQPVT
jgi:hypothetical protein